jgi:hypothetical protein
MRKRSNLSPKEDLASESLDTMKRAQSKMSPRQFREAITRANGAVTGVKTHMYDGKRWGV